MGECFVCVVDCILSYCVYAAGDTINDLLNKVYGIIAGIPVPFPGFPDSAADVCTLAADGTSKCPIKVGDSFTEKVTLPVISSAPAVSYTIIMHIVCVLNTMTHISLFMMTSRLVQGRGLIGGLKIMILPNGAGLGTMCLY